MIRNKQVAKHVYLLDTLKVTLLILSLIMKVVKEIRARYNFMRRSEMFSRLHSVSE